MGNAQYKTEDTDDSFMDELSPGTELLNGQFKIMQFLNSGGFGITYLAKDSLDRKVVIKECFPSSFCNRSRSIVQARSRAHTAELKSVVELFVQEARSLAKLDHPNIVGVHQVFEDNQTAYMVLDFVEGRDLLDTLEDKNHGLTPAQIKGLLTDVLSAVGFIHGKDILHRDISPDNILIDGDMRPVLIDFGAAREEATKKSRVLSAMRVVKDGYSPQEFYVQGSAQTPSSDLYALAATFYHLIVGEIPPNSQARLAAIASGEADPYVPLLGRIRGYDSRFLTAIDKALGILPKDRLQSAQEWLDLMNGTRRTSRVVSRVAPVSSAAAATEATQERSRLVPLLGSVAAIALMAIGGLTMSGNFKLAGAGDNAAVLTKPASPSSANVGMAQTAGLAAEAETSQAIAPVEAASFDVIAAAPEVAPVDLTQIAAEEATDFRVAEVAEPALVAETLSGAEIADVEAPLEVATAQSPLAAPGTPLSAAPVDIPVSAEKSAEPVAQTPVEEVISGQAPEIAVLDIEGPAPAGVDAAPKADFAALSNVSAAQAPSLPTPAEVAEPALDIAALTQPPVIDIAPAAAPLAETPEPAVIEETAPFVESLVVELPFGGDAQNAVIDRVADISPTWVQIGAEIVAVNGTEIQNIAEISGLVEGMLGSEDTAQKELVFTVKANGSETTQDHVWTVPLKHRTTLNNGVTFEASFVNDAWVTRVVKAPGGRNALKTGDTVVAFMATSERMTDHTTLRDIVTRETAKGAEQLNFAVMREGSIWVVTMTQTGGA